jgi:hypothetical protein
MRHVLLLVPCLAGCLTQTVTNSTARVPHATVPLSSGHPLDAPVEGSVGLSNVSDLVAPTVGNTSQAVEVPAVQGRGELRFQVGRGEIDLITEHGLAHYQVPDRTQLPVDHGAPRGYGMGLRRAIRNDNPNFTLGLGFEMMFWAIPTTNSDSSDIVPTLGAGVTPSYRVGRWTLFGGVFVRNHPTIQRLTTQDAFSGRPHADPGVLNLLIHLGAEVALTDTVSALVLINQDVVTDPVQYGPNLGIALAFHAAPTPPAPPRAP